MSSFLYMSLTSEWRGQPGSDETGREQLARGTETACIALQQLLAR
jgi:hypothetical protein